MSLFCLRVEFESPFLLFSTGADGWGARNGREREEPGPERSRPCSESSWYEAENKSPLFLIHKPSPSLSRIVITTG